MRVWVLVVALIGCAKHEPARQLDKNLIHVTPDARLRTDTIGSGQFSDLATFVLVEAENTAREGADVTLGGELTDEAGKTVGELRAQSVYVPAGETRTFALVDKQRKARPDAKAARIYVRGAQVPKHLPPVTIDGIRQLEDNGKTVVQAVVKNDAERGGNIMVIATFYDAQGKPMTRPFSMLWVDKHAELPVQFAGPSGSTRGTIFLGDVAY